MFTGTAAAGTPAVEIIERLAAEADIRQILMRYCRAIDRCDAELLRSCYHADAWDDHGIIRGQRDEFVEFTIDALTARHASHGQITSHVLANVLIEFEGSASAGLADVESYFTAAHVEDRPDHFRVFQFQGRYLDRFECRDGAWKIAHRRVVHDWSEIRENRRGLRPGTHPYAQGGLCNGPSAEPRSVRSD